MRPALFALLLVSACAGFPELKAASRGPIGPAPQLLPLDSLLAEADAGRAGEPSIRSVEGRAAALRARAAGLRAR